MCFSGSKSRAHKNPVWAEEDSWQKVVICIVADGRRHLNPAILKVLAAMGCWQEGVAKNQVNGKAVQAHIFEVNINKPAFNGHSFSFTPDAKITRSNVACRHHIVLDPGISG